MIKKISMISFTIFIIDFLLKLIIANTIKLYDFIIIIPNFFNLTYVRNYGAGFSILQNQRIFLIIMGLLTISIIIYYLIKTKNLKQYEIIIFAILIGGILGNLYDRIILGYVIDYLDFLIFGYNFPVFNFADCSIVLSAIILIILSIKDEINENKSRR